MTSECKRETKYIYSAFGMTVASEIPIPEFMAASGAADINIICGKVPVKLQNITGRAKNCQFSKDQLLFHIEGIGQYYVRQGSSIIVEPEENTDIDLLRLFLLGTAFGALLLQRGMLPIHGSAIVINGQCVIFTGVSGIGKSTLSSALRQLGHLFLSDDVSVIKFNEGGIPLVQPGYPQQKLCGDAIKNIGENSNLCRRIDAERDKFAVPVRKGFLNSAVRLGLICELTMDNCSKVHMNRISGTEKLMVLMKNIFRFEMLKWFGMSPEFFQNCLEIAGHTDFFRMTRPTEKFSIQEQIELIEKKLELRSHKAI